MEGHAEKYVERYCEQNNSTTIQSRDAMYGRPSKKEEMGSVGEMSMVR